MKINFFNNNTKLGFNSNAELLKFFNDDGTGNTFGKFKVTEAIAKNFNDLATPDDEANCIAAIANTVIDMMVNVPEVRILKTINFTGLLQTTQEKLKEAVCSAITSFIRNGTVWERTVSSTISTPNFNFGTDTPNGFLAGMSFDRRTKDLITASNISRYKIVGDNGKYKLTTSDDMILIKEGDGRTLGVKKGEATNTNFQTYTIPSVTINKYDYIVLKNEQDELGRFNGDDPNDKQNGTRIDQITYDGNQYVVYDDNIIIGAARTTAQELSTKMDILRFYDSNKQPLQDGSGYIYDPKRYMFGLETSTIEGKNIVKILGRAIVVQPDGFKKEYPIRIPDQVGIIEQIRLAIKDGAQIKEYGTTTEGNNRTDKKVGDIGIILGAISAFNSIIFHTSTGDKQLLNKEQVEKLLQFIKNDMQHNTDTIMQNTNNFKYISNKNNGNVDNANKKIMYANNGTPIEFFNLAGMFGSWKDLSTTYNTRTGNADDNGKKVRILENGIGFVGEIKGSPAAPHIFSTIYDPINDTSILPSAAKVFFWCAKDVNGFKPDQISLVSGGVQLTNIFYWEQLQILE